jgi:protein TonB
VKRRQAFRRLNLREPVRAAAPSIFDGRGTTARLIFAGVIVASALAHGLALKAAPHPTPRAPAPPPARVRVTVVEPPPAPEAPPPPPTAMARPRRATTPTPKAVPQAAPPTEAPPPPSEPATASDAPPVVIPGASLTATSPTGTAAVGVGNTQRGRAVNAPPGEAKPYRAAEYAESYALTEAPVFLDNVSYEQLRMFYPEDARKAGTAGRVRTKLLIDDDGSVAEVTVLDDPGQGFGAAARRVAKLYRFKPGRVNGRAVATEIVMTINFELR